MRLPRSMGGAHPIELHCTPNRPPLYLYQASFGAPKVHPLVNLGKIGIEQVRTLEVQFKFKGSPF